MAARFLAAFRVLRGGRIGDVTRAVGGVRPLVLDGSVGIRRHRVRVQRRRLVGAVVRLGRRRGRRHRVVHVDLHRRHRRLLVIRIRHRSGNRVVAGDCGSTADLAGAGIIVHTVGKTRHVNVAVGTGDRHLCDISI